MNSKQSEIILSSLRDAASSVLFPSETDAPLVPLYWSAAEVSAPFTGQDLLTYQHLPLDTRVERVEFESFFRAYLPDAQALNAGEIDPEQQQTRERLSHIAALMRDQLTDLHVYRSGEIRVDIYILGRDRARNIIGFRTLAVET